MTTLAAAIEGQEGARLSGARRLALRAEAQRSGVLISPEIAANYGLSGEIPPVTHILLRPPGPYGVRAATWRFCGRASCDIMPA